MENNNKVVGTFLPCSMLQKYLSIGMHSLEAVIREIQGRSKTILQRVF